MSTLKKDEFFASIRGIIGDRNDPDSIKFLEDMSDTYASLEKAGKGDGIDWEAKYKENDKAWADRYRNRFLSGDGGVEPQNQSKNNPGGYEPETVDYNDLFK